jgi:hypothetical protein
MVDLLAKEAGIAGMSLTDQEKEVLLQDRSRRNPLPDELRQKAIDLIGKIFEVEDTNETVEYPKSFSSSMYWADGAGYPNILALAEEVACDSARTTPPLQGWELVKDRMRLTGCGILVVLLMFAMVIVAGIIFHWK